MTWTEWTRFPDPRERGTLRAPFGPGVYQLRRADTAQLVLVGRGKNTAFRMTSLLPAPLGQGRRDNSAKQEYVLTYLSKIEYRCWATETEAMAEALERECLDNDDCLFHT
jgi:hypothetical protein